MTDRLDSGIGIIILYKAYDSFTYVRPLVRAGKKFKGGRSTRMAKGRVIVGILDDTTLKVLIIRDID